MSLGINKLLGLDAYRKFLNDHGSVYQTNRFAIIVGSNLKDIAGTIINTAGLSNLNIINDPRAFTFLAFSFTVNGVSVTTFEPSSYAMRTLKGGIIEDKENSGELTINFINTTDLYIRNYFMTKYKKQIGEDDSTAKYRKDISFDVRILPLTKGDSFTDFLPTTFAFEDCIIKSISDLTFDVSSDDTNTTAVTLQYAKMREGIRL